MPSLIAIERSKMSSEMWEKLKVHIIRQREKRKQEQEQDAEQERLRREQELKRKKDAMTLEEIKDQLNKLETKLKDMRKEKTELFSQLKKVLNEGPAVRKKPREREPELTGPQPLNNHVYHPYFISTSMMSAASVANCQPPMYHRNPTLNVPMSPIVSNSNFMSQQATNHTQVVPVSMYSVPGVTSSPANSLKRPMQRSYEKSPSPPGVPYTGILPVYKNPMSYTPALPRTTQSGSYLYYPQGTPSQIACDVKGNPYHIFPSGGPFSTENQQIEAAEYEASKLRYDYQQQIRAQALVGPPHPSTSSLIPIQTGPTKPGGISTGFPVQRVSGSTSGPSSGPGRDVRDSVPVLYPGRDVREHPPVPFHGRDVRDPYPGRDIRDSSVPYPLYY